MSGEFADPEIGLDLTHFLASLLGIRDGLTSMWNVIGRFLRHRTYTWNPGGMNIVTEMLNLQVGLVWVPGEGNRIYLRMQRRKSPGTEKKHLHALEHV